MLTWSRINFIPTKRGMHSRGHRRSTARLQGCTGGMRIHVAPAARPIALSAQPRELAGPGAVQAGLAAHVQLRAAGRIHGAVKQAAADGARL